MGILLWQMLNCTFNQLLSNEESDMGRTSNRNLMDYITFVKNLEVSVYEQQSVLSNLNNGIITTYCGEQYAERKGHLDSGMCLLAGNFFGVLGGILLALLFFHTFLAFAAGIVIGNIFAVIIWLVDALDVKKENKKIDQFNREVDKKNYKIEQGLTRKNQLISKEIEYVKSNLRKTSHILNQVYDMNVIHKKYRHNVVFICSIYEYLDTGRCNKLEGHEGAYNLLESDIKYHMIMDKLDIIITKLEDIRESQYELYSAIKNTNRTIKQLNSSIGQLAVTMDNMQNNLECIEYNSRIEMQNGEFLKWYAYFNDKRVARA